MEERELQRIGTLVDLGRGAEAESRVRAFLIAHPDSDAALRLLALALHAQGRDREARAAAVLAVQAQPDEAMSHIVLADLHRERGERFRSNAVRAADEAVRLAPHYSMAYFARANALSGGTASERHRALADAQQALALAPGSADAHNLLGVCLGGVGRSAEQRAAYEEALRLEPQHVLARNNLAVLDLRRGRLSAARRQLASALASNPQMELMHRNHDALMMRVHGRAWWGAVAIGIVEGILLAKGIEAWVRVLVAVALVGTNLLMVRHLLGGSLRTVTLMPGMVRRMPRGRWALLVYWALTWICIGLLAGVPRDQAEGALYTAGAVGFYVVVALGSATLRLRAHP